MSGVPMNHPAASQHISPGSAAPHSQSLESIGCCERTFPGNLQGYLAHKKERSPKTLP